MISLRLQGHPNAPLAVAVEKNEETGVVETVVFADVRTAIMVEVSLSDDDRRVLLAALQGKPVIQTAVHLP